MQSLTPSPPLTFAPYEQTPGRVVGEFARLLAAAPSESWAQERLYRDWVQFVASVARGAGVRPSELEDVVHDTFLTLFASLNSLEAPERFRGWLARLTVRQVGRHRRWRRWLTLFSDPGDEAQAWQTLLDESATAEQIAEVKRVGEQLRAHRAGDALMWVLHRWHGLSIAEAAEASGVSVATVKRKVAAIDQALEAWATRSHE